MDAQGGSPKKAMIATKQQNPIADFGIRRIMVERLFGQFNYDIRAEMKSREDFPRLIILYGENGSGKTTVLKLAFNLLSSSEGKGHKTSVARTPFRRVEIQLAGGTSVTAERSAPSLVGSFRATIRKGKQVIAAFTFKPDEGGDIRTSSKDEPELSGFLASLADLHMGLYFLADDRTIASDRFPEDSEEEESSTKSSDLFRYITAFKRIELSERTRQDALEGALERLKTWVTQRVLKGSTQGEEDVNAIYADIVKRLAGGATTVVPGKQPSLEKLINDLREQVKRSEAFAVFGLTSVPNVEALVRSAQGARKGPIVEAVTRVLEPYVDGMRAKLNALQDVQRSISAFVRTMNSFYSNKSVSFDVHEGVLIKASNEETIGPAALSSGERQLLLLFCNTVVAKDQPSIFIIDEPELSLNVTWQRGLVDSLLDMTSDSKVQFLLATHSIELLTRHRDRVAELREQRPIRTHAHSSKEN